MIIGVGLTVLHHIETSHKSSLFATTDLRCYTSMGPMTLTFHLRAKEGDGDGGVEKRVLPVPPFCCLHISHSFQLPLLC